MRYLTALISKKHSALLLGLSLATSGTGISRAQAAPGDLDPSFGLDGKVTHDFGVLGGAGGAAHAVVTLADGKTLIAGQTAYGTNADFAVLRLKADGKLDPTFGKQGKVAVPLGDLGDIAYAMTIDSKQRIVLAGTYALGQDFCFGAARLLPNGTLDTTFGKQGKVLFPKGSVEWTAYGVAVDSQNRIVLGGRARTGGKNGFAVARLLENGQFDTKFDGDGRRTVFFAGSTGYARAVIIGANGKIILAGEASPDARSLTQFAAVRFNEGGGLDKSFSEDGMTTVPAKRDSVQVFAATRDQKNRIVIAGGVSANMAVCRINPDGNPDLSFNHDGIRVVSAGSGYNRAYAVTSDSQNRIVLAGTAGEETGVVRLREGGDLDVSLNGTGKVTHKVPAYAGDAYAVAVDVQGRIILAGQGGLNMYSSNTGDMYALRLMNNGALDPAFAQGGMIPAFYHGNDSLVGARRLSNGKIILAGTCSNIENDDFGITCLNQDGTIDQSFGDKGQKIVPVGNSDDIATAMVVDSKNRTLVAGLIYDGYERKIGLLRLTPEGGLDTTFNGSGRLVLSAGREIFTVTTLRLDRSGKILVGCQGSSFSDFILIRLNTDGTLDKSFGRNGVVKEQGQLTGVIHGLAIDGKNRILVAVAATSDRGVRVLRLTPTGTLDLGFGNEGRKLLTNDSRAQLTSLVLAPNGKIVVAASSLDRLQPARLWRLNPDGTSDLSFDGDGEFSFTFGDLDSGVGAIGVRSDESIVVAGSASSLVTFYGTNGDFAVAVVKSTGGLDTTFGDGGFVTTDFHGRSDYGASIVLYDDGRILIAGSANGGVDGSKDFAVARYIGPAIGAKQNAPSGPSARFSRLFQ